MLIKLNSLIIRQNIVKISFRNMSSAIKITERKIRVNDVDINYVESGQGDKAILLMPGALGSAWTDFTPQINKLPNTLPNHTIIAWDPPGYGKSIPAKCRFSLDFYEDDAKYANDLMKELKFNKYCILGWSDGGVSGLIMASKYPQAIDKLVVWGSNAYITPEEAKIYESIRDVNKWSERMRKPMENLYGKENFSKFWHDWVDTLLKIFSERNGNICKEHLKNITCPTLIVHGAKDPMIAKEHVPYLMNHIKGAKLHVVPDGKHNIHLRYDDEFNAIVSDFLLSKDF